MKTLDFSKEVSEVWATSGDETPRPPVIPSSKMQSPKELKVVTTNEDESMLDLVSNLKFKSG
jgi:hypothetical protein